MKYIRFTIKNCRLTASPACTSMTLFLHHVVHPLRSLAERRVSARRGRAGEKKRHFEHPAGGIHLVLHSRGSRASEIIFQRVYNTRSVLAYRQFKIADRFAIQGGDAPAHQRHTAGSGDHGGVVGAVTKRGETQLNPLGSSPVGEKRAQS